VIDAPIPGTTYFTDASSLTHRAAVVWLEGKDWKAITWEGRAPSVQWLEAKAVTIALGLEPSQHINICTDSMYVFKLIRLMKYSGAPNSAIAEMLSDALQLRSGTVAIMHTRSHTDCPGPIVEGNRKADEKATGVWSVQEARKLHEFLHLGARAL
ncbi:PO113 protein, partial [Crypturellus undulatus]|nr:PO113 protein [Crypturellus undulatus]